jgi:branched-chain amino acid transport system permease protein
VSARKAPRKVTRRPARAKTAAAEPAKAFGAVTDEIQASEDLAAEVHEKFEAPKIEKSDFKVTHEGLMIRRAVLAGIIGFFVLLPMLVGESQQGWISYALVFVVIGLSVNVLMGYAGQISLGHQAFVGVGAFTSALMTSQHHVSFWIAFLLAGVTGALSAVVLGLVALRLKGLFLALVTLAYGTLATNTLFNWGSLTGGGAGSEAPRPAGFTTARRYDYLCMIIVAALLYIDWRFVKSKVGRAIFAIRENEVAAASFGINVTVYKLIAFVISGIIAGFGGSLFAHQQTLVVSSSFDFNLALTFVLMVVVGGLSSRVGVFIGSAFFAVFRFLLGLVHVGSGDLTKYADFAGAVLLLVTLTQFPGGIAQQIEPLLRWFRGGPLRGHGKGQSISVGGAGVRP